MTIQGKTTVLVINDEPDALDLMTFILSRAGYNILTAQNGNTGLEIAKHTTPDLIISDVMMPNLNGIELCRLLRADTSLKTTPIILVSAVHKNNETAIEGLEAGADDYIEVPFESERLVAKVARLLERKMSEQLLQESREEVTNILESITDAFYALDSDWNFTYVNQAAEYLLNRPQKELLGRNVWNEYPAAVNATFYLMYHQAMNEKVAVEFIESYPAPLNKWYEFRVYPAKNGISVYFRDVTQRMETEKQLQHDAFHDALTGLANRAFFNQYLQKTIERTKRDNSDLFAVLFFDLDRFKIINDSLGHAEGDNLLKQIARRLESTLRSGDLFARLGGDEFTILVNNLRDPSVVSLIADHIQTKLEIPFDIGGNKIFISASIGIALSTTKYEIAEDMLRDADIAMYRAKAKGKAQHQVFDQTMREQALTQMRIETEMRDAIEDKEFLVYYQPVMNLETDSLVGFEALVRWNHKMHGILLPFQFIGTAEENGLILPLGKWVLHESCRQLRDWQKSNPTASDLTVSVNLSSKQFLQSDLAEQISVILKETGLNPHCLKLEITESHLMENIVMTTQTITKLRALGIELSIDDFGTGYSSLSYLHSLPVSYLKIDRSFIARMMEGEENSEIVHTIIKLAQNLKMKVIAEGIETSEQLIKLKMLNCEYGQGYIFAKPMEAKAAETFIAKSLENLTSSATALVANEEFDI
jgi:diguanylate cyclase (GGDEF)-like protein/PAS domain S-box-containing protein